MSGWQLHWPILPVLTYDAIDSVIDRINAGDKPLALYIFDRTRARVEEITRRVAALTDKLPRQEQIKDLRVMLEELTMDNGLLTPTLKVKRRQVEERFGALIEDMYAKVAQAKDRLHH